MAVGLQLRMPCDRRRHNNNLRVNYATGREAERKTFETSVAATAVRLCDWVGPEDVQVRTAALASRVECNVWATQSCELFSGTGDTRKLCSSAV